MENDVTERNEEVAASAIADLSAAVGAGRTAWGSLADVDIVVLLRRDIHQREHFVIDLGGGERLKVTIEPEQD